MFKSNIYLLLYSICILNSKLIIAMKAKVLTFNGKHEAVLVEDGTAYYSKDGQSLQDFKKDVSADVLDEHEVEVTFTTVVYSNMKSETLRGKLADATDFQTAAIKAELESRLVEDTSNEPEQPNDADEPEYPQGSPDAPADEDEKADDAEGSDEGTGAIMVVDTFTAAKTALELAVTNFGKVYEVTNPETDEVEDEGSADVSDPLLEERKALYIAQNDYNNIKSKVSDIVANTRKQYRDDLEKATKAYSEARDEAEEQNGKATAAFNAAKHKQTGIELGVVEGSLEDAEKATAQAEEVLDNTAKKYAEILSESKATLDAITHKSEQAIETAKAAITEAFLAAKEALAVAQANFNSEHAKLVENTTSKIDTYKALYADAKAAYETSRDAASKTRKAMLEAKQMLRDTKGLVGDSSTKSTSTPARSLAVAEAEAKEAEKHVGKTVQFKKFRSTDMLIGEIKSTFIDTRVNYGYFKVAVQGVGYKHIKIDRFDVAAAEVAASKTLAAQSEEQKKA